MSVRKNDRQESTMEFLYHMKKVHREMIAFLMRCPKRWDKFLTENTAHVITMALIHVKAANSIYPTNQRERYDRREEFVKALSNLQSAITLLDVLFDFANSSENLTDFKVDEERIDRIMEYFKKEIRLIKGVMYKDTQRYKNLPDK